MEVYDPSIHGAAVPMTPEEEEKTRARLQSPAQAGGSPSGGLEVYDPSLHGEAVSEDPNRDAWAAFDLMTSDAAQDYAGEAAAHLSTLPQEAQAAEIQKFRENAERVASPPEPSALDRRNWPVLASDLIGGAYEGIRRPIERVSGLADEAFDSAAGAFGFDTASSRQKVRDAGIATGVSDVLPEYEGNSQTVVDISAAVAPTLGLGIGAGAGAAALGAGRVFGATGLATAAGATLGETLARRPGTDRLFLGEEASFFQAPLLLDEKDPEGNERKFATFVNDFADAFALAYPAQVVTDTGAVALSALNKSILKPAIALVRNNERSMELSMAERLTHALGLAQNAKTPQERAQYIRSAADILRDNPNRVVDVAGEAVPLPRDSMSAFERGPLPGMTDEDFRRTTDAASGIRRGHVEGPYESARTDEVLSTPSREADRIMSQTEEMLGGSQRVDEAGGAIQQQARREFADRSEPLISAEDALARRNEVIEETLGSNHALREVFDRIDAEGADIAVESLRYETVQEAREQLLSAHKLMKDQMDEYAKNIESGHVRDFMDLADIFADGNVPKSISRHFDIEEVAGGIGAISGDAKELYQKAIPAISREIDNIVNRGGGSDFNDLIRIREAIYEELESVPGADKFSEFYKETWAPVWGDGVLEKFNQNVRQNLRNRPVEFASRGNQLVTEGLQNPEYAKQVNKLLSSEYGGQTEHLVTDFHLADVAKSLQKALNSAGGDLSKVDTKTILEPLERYGHVIKETDPQSYKKLNDFSKLVRDGNLDREALEKTVQEAEEAAVRAIDEVFKRDYKEFFDDQLRPLIGDQYKNFTDLLDSEDALTRVPQILDRARASGNTEIIEGMQAAYIRHLKNTAFSSKSPLQAGGKRTTSEVSELLGGDRRGNLIRIGDELLADQPGLMEGIESLIRVSDDLTQKLSSARARSPQDFNRFAREGSAGLDRIITMAFGALNRFGARLRSIKGGAVQALDPKDRAMQIFDEMMANPEYMAKVFDDLASVEAKAMTPETRRSIITLLTFMGQDILSDKEIEEEADRIIETFASPLDRQSRDLFSNRGGPTEITVTDPTGVDEDWEDWEEEE